MPLTPQQLARKAAKIVVDAEDAGIEIDDSNVIDLLADNLPGTLDELRAALRAGGMSSRFPKASKAA
jgi:uncharacterized protein with von Willebrand factor type A (vWA) domain